MSKSQPDMRFVVLYHETPDESSRPSHWDLMLEQHDHLETWSLDRDPTHAGELHAQPNAPHRKRYLDYEGELSNQRGHVSRCESGTYRWLHRNTSDGLLELNSESGLRRLVVSFAVDGDGLSCWEVDVVE